MKNKTPMANHPNQNKAMGWLDQKEMEDDFLMGKTPSEFQDIGEDE